MNQLFLKVKKKVNRVIEYAIAILYLYIAGNNKRHDGEKSILIINTGVLGDSVLLMDYLQMMYQTYVEHNGYHMTIVCTAVIRDLYQLFLSIERTRFLCYEDRNNLSIKEYLGIIRLLREKTYQECLCVDTHYIGRYINSCVTANHNYCLTKEYRKGNVIDYFERFMIKKLYKNGSITLDPRGFIKGSYKALLCLLKIDIDLDFVIVRKKPQGLSENKYIILAPESSIVFRNIPIGHSVNIIAYILKKTPYDIVITSNKAGGSYINEIVKEYYDNPRVKDMTGTTLPEFIDLIAGSVFMIGSESGHVHLAAYLGKDSICVAGYWDKGLFFPYDDSYNTGETSPLLVYGGQEPSCKNCAGNIIINRECHSYLMNNDTAKCLQDLKSEEIYEKLDLQLQKIKSEEADEKEDFSDRRYYA